MKKVLFASTALVAFTGAAAADITISGNAEMGIFLIDEITLTPDGFGDGFDAEEDNGEVQFFTDIDVTFTMSGVTDGGLTFGATIDLDESDDGDAFDPSDQGGETLFLSGGFGTITMGDTDGALDWALTEVTFNGGSLADDETSHFGYNGNGILDGLEGDGQILRYDYSFGQFGIAFSLEQEDDGDGDEIWGVGGRYNGDFNGVTFNIGLAYQEGDDAEAFGVSVNASLANGFTIGAQYTDFDDTFVDVDDLGFAVADFDSHYGVGVGYTTGPISLSANYGEFDTDLGDFEGIGLSAGYDLGGGAAIQAGYGYSDTPFGDIDQFSFGLRMNF